MSRTFKIEPHGKRFATVCRTDGYWSITFLSKNKRAAKRKGEEFISGERNAFYEYTTAYGRVLNEAKSNRPRRVVIVSGGRTSMASLALAVATSSAKERDGE